MPLPVLDYQAPEPDRHRPQPVGKRTLVAGVSVAATAAVVGVALAAQGDPRAGGFGQVIMLLGGVAALVLAVTAAVEARFFPQNVSDPRQAARSAVVNLVAGLGLLAVRSWIG